MKKDRNCGGGMFMPYPTPYMMPYQYSNMPYNNMGTDMNTSNNQINNLEQRLNNIETRLSKLESKINSTYSWISHTFLIIVMYYSFATFKEHMFYLVRFEIWIFFNNKCAYACNHRGCHTCARKCCIRIVK